MERLRDLKPGPILAVAAAGLLWLIAPEVYTGTFSDLGTFLLVALMVGAVAVWVFGIRRFVRRREIRWGLIGVPIAVLAWVVLWPYLRPPTKVDEAFPDVVAAPQPATDEAATPATEEPDPTLSDAPPAASIGATDENGTDRVEGNDSTSTTERPEEAAAAPTTTAPPAASAQPATTAPPAASTQQATTTTEPPTGSSAPTTTTEPPPEPADTTSTTTTTVPPTTTTTTTTTTTVPAGPVELRRAGFQGLTGHRGSGDAAVYRLEDDSILLRFEEVDIGSGPALHVWLVPGADQRGLGGGTYVAPLTAEQGNQNYSIPAGVDLTTGTWTVLVWCDTFSVEVANATLA